MENSSFISTQLLRSWQWLRTHVELLFWATALLALYLTPANIETTSLCPVTWLGLGRCPGCGIGHAIHDVLHLDWKTSLQHHFMGIPAVLIIFSRIIRLLTPTKTRL